MTEHRSGCLVCSKELLYLNETRKLNCHYCDEFYDADAMCVDSHYVCDACHSLSANDIILKTYIDTRERDPVKLAVELMRNHAVNMHGARAFTRNAHQSKIPLYFTAHKKNGTRE